jgi:CRISPR/Cas system-associated protein Cas10 (large subunit of type III CRISPR-Cas system)
MPENNPFMPESDNEHTFRRLDPNADAWYECTVCGKEFYTKDSARKHWRKQELSDEYNNERR